MSRYLVVGGGGFLGSHLVRSLLASGQEVSVIDIVSRDNASKLKSVVDRITYTWKAALDFSPLDVLDYDYILHVAAQADVPLAISSPKYTYDMNLGAALALLEAIRATNSGRLKKVLFMSSENVYGSVPLDRLPVTEDELPRPTNAYAASKVAVEALCRAYSTQWGIPIAVIRSTTLFGEDSRLMQAVPIFIRQALSGQPITIEGDGSQSRDFNYVDNCVDGIAAALETEQKFGIWNIGSGEETSIRKLAETVIRLTGSSSQIVQRPWRPGEQGLRLSVSIEKAKKELGYQPIVSLDGGLAATIAWLNHPRPSPGATIAFKQQQN